MRNPRNSIRAKQKGSALIIILWVSLFVSIVLGATLNALRTETKVTMAREKIFLERQALISALERAAAAIASDERQNSRSANSFEYTFGEIVVLAERSREMQKVDINLAPAANLSDLFQFLGANTQEADALAARIADWRDTDDLTRMNGAEKREYAAGNAASHIGNRNFYSISELNLVLDAPKNLIECAAPALTVFGGQSFADPGLLAELYGLPASPLSDKSNSNLGTSSFAPTAGQRAAIKARVANVGDAPEAFGRSLTGVFRITGDPDAPYEWIAQFEPITDQFDPSFCEGVGVRSL